MLEVLLIGMVSAVEPPPSLLASLRSAPATSAPDTLPTPEGRWALTDEIEVVITPAPDGSGEAAWTFTIGEGEPHAVRRERGGAWSVPDLDATFHLRGSGAASRLALTRFGETFELAPAGSDAAIDPGSGDIGETLDALTPRLMTALDVPGVSVAVIRGGEIAELRQYGIKTRGEAAPVTAETVFEAASMSKPAYAYAFLQLVEEGVMELDVPLVEYLGRDYIEEQPLHREITARMVLTHTTGFPNWRRGGDLEVQFRPGTESGYSGEGFLYLQTVVEEVTGEPTQEFARRRLLRPLGMTSSSFQWEEAYERTYATGHTADGHPRERRPYAEANSAYTLYTTPRDYARYLVELMREDRSSPHSLGPEALAGMLAPNEYIEGRRPIARGLPGEQEARVHFALGWRKDQLPSGARYYHSGSNSTGFQCYSEFDPATGSGIVIMTNSSSGSPLWRALMRRIGSL